MLVKLQVILFLTSDLKSEEKMLVVIVEFFPLVQVYHSDDIFVAIPDLFDRKVL